MFDVIGSDVWSGFDRDLDDYFAAVLLPGDLPTPLAGAACAPGPGSSPSAGSGQPIS